MGERVWDRFLTEQDKADIARKPHQRIGFGARPALLLIDLYRWVFGDEPQPILEATRDWPSSCGLTGWQSLPHIQRLLGAAREAGIPVIHVTMLDVDGLTGWSEAARRDTIKPITDPAMLERWRRRTDIVDEVAPIAGELVLRKTAPSAFWGTPLVAHLNYLDVDTLLVAGESTSGCVRASVIDAVSNRFRTMVVEECVFDHHEKYADVIQVNEAVAYLDRVSGERQAKDGEPRQLVSAS
jgi:maleamate amidohydrolase